MMITSGLNAKRFAGKPLKQPLYRFESVPRCSKDLKGSTLYDIVNRDDFVDATAEMVLLCNEAIRRSKQTSAKKTSKPLSLEYIADRLDIDDPMTGFFVRNEESKLQGFITCTTFTNWQKSFRWDSVHEASFSYDDDKLAREMLSGERVHDVDGSLAAGLQQSIHCGDPWNEGIVWPRIAEISLLGGLGCGKALLSMVLERLETLKATSDQNYDYVVLQATENSIPFYESVGFVRVGALTVDTNIENMSKSGSSDDNTESDESSPKATAVNRTASTDSLADPPEIVSSPVNIYVVEKPGESPVEIAKKFNVPVWDVVYLNRYVYKDLNSRSYLMKGTSLYVPSESKAKSDACTHALSKKDLEGESSAPRWYIASENDTPKVIARRFGVACKELVQANVARLPELLPVSRLKEGTRVKVSHFHLHEDHHVPYCHWTFPDDKFENAEPSYMMARKLNRRSGNAAKVRPVLAALSVPISKYVRPPESLFHVVMAPTKTPKKTLKPAISIPGKPKRALSAYIIFCQETRGSLSMELAGKPATEYSKLLSARWKEVGDEEKAIYQRKHESAKKEYDKSLQKYEKNLERFFEKHPEMRPSDEEEDGSGTDADTLFNKVVTVKPGTLGTTHKGFQYFYVLTYIPDLVWCHLAPMRQVGYWGADMPNCEGRPKWMLVDESEGKEVDISASFCQTVNSRALNKTVDADHEQWDIPGSGVARKMPAGMPDGEAGASRVYSANAGAKEPPPSSAAPSKKPTKLVVPKKRKRDDEESSKAKEPSALDALLGSPRVSEGSRDLPSRPENLVSDKLPPPAKKRKVTSPLKKHAAVQVSRGATREMPRRRAAPRAEGVFSENKSPLPARCKKVPYKRALGKASKKTQGPPTKLKEEYVRVKSSPKAVSARRALHPALKKCKGDLAILAEDVVRKESSPLAEPVRRAPRKTLKKRGGPKTIPVEETARDESSSPAELARRTPRKALKKRGRFPKITGEETGQKESSTPAEPARRAPRKTVKKRGRPVEVPHEDSSVKGADTADAFASKPRGVHRELLRRRSVPTVQGFYSESPSKKPTRRSQTSSKLKDSPSDQKRCQATEKTPVCETRSTEEDTRQVEVTAVEKAAVSEKADAPSPVPKKSQRVKENTHTSTIQTNTGISLLKSGSPRLRKRLRPGERQQSLNPTQAKVEVLAIRSLRNRKPAAIFARAPRSISSPLLMRHRLVAS